MGALSSPKPSSPPIPLQSSLHSSPQTFTHSRAFLSYPQSNIQTLFFVGGWATIAVGNREKSRGVLADAKTANLTDVHLSYRHFVSPSLPSLPHPSTTEARWKYNPHHFYTYPGSPSLTGLSVKTGFDVM